MLPEITPAQLATRLHAAEPPFVLDVREPFEVAQGAIPEAVNIPLAELAARAGELPRHGEIVVVCRSGNRSAMATEALLRGGWDARNLVGGMMAWESSGGAAVPNVVRRVA